MNTSATPFVECEQVHAGLAVTGIAAARAHREVAFTAVKSWGYEPLV